MEYDGQWHGLNWKLAGSAGDPMADIGGSMELQPRGAPGKEKCAKCEGTLHGDKCWKHCTETLAAWSSA